MFIYFYLHARARMNKVEQGTDQMTERSWKDQKDELCLLIKLSSENCGGDDVEWLRQYCVDIIQSYKDDLKTPLACFKDVTKGLDVLRGTYKEVGYEDREK